MSTTGHPQSSQQHANQLSSSFTGQTFRVLLPYPRAVGENADPRVTTKSTPCPGLDVFYMEREVGQDSITVTTRIQDSVLLTHFPFTWADFFYSQLSAEASSVRLRNLMGTHGVTAGIHRLYDDVYGQDTDGLVSDLEPSLVENLAERVMDTTMLNLSRNPISSSDVQWQIKHPQLMSMVVFCGLEAEFTALQAEAAMGRISSEGDRLMGCLVKVLDQAPWTRDLDNYKEVLSKSALLQIQADQTNESFEAPRAAA